MWYAVYISSILPKEKQKTKKKCSHGRIWMIVYTLINMKWSDNEFVFMLSLVTAAWIVLKYHWWQILAVSLPTSLIASSLYNINNTENMHEIKLWDETYATSFLISRVSTLSLWITVLNQFITIIQHIEFVFLSLSHLYIWCVTTPFICQL